MLLEATKSVGVCPRSLHGLTRPSRDEVSVVFLRIDTYDAARFAQFVHMLSTEEINRYRAFKGARKSEFVASRLLLRYLLVRHFRLRPDRVRIASTEHGKPFLQNDAAIKFNISHSSGLIAIAVTATDEIGIDVEKIQMMPLSSEVMDIVLTAGERQYLASLTDTDQLKAFYRLFTLKEALIKAVGLGLKIPLNSFEAPLGGSTCVIDGWEFFNSEYCDAVFMMSCVTRSSGSEPHKYQLFEIDSPTFGRLLANASW